MAQSKVRVGDRVMIGSGASLKDTHKSGEVVSRSPSGAYAKVKLLPEGDIIEVPVDHLRPLS